ncbi:response regulator [Pseudomonas endophytica]|uniref:Response regulator n=1 Tax=Pseudomonas endophytica TaxID=1563157 RepID=A0A0N8VT38_9PSED|nr:response regulator [Pseudomonas endophytica]KQB55044.1 response regulator [Pseudomonas endophytica]
MTDHDILTDAEREALNEVMLEPPEVERSLLIVEDDPDSRSVLSEFLALNGIHCVTASNEEEALKLLKSDSSIGMMLTDLRMQPHDGLHLIQEVHKSERAQLPIAIMSGDAEVRDVIEALHLGLVDFLLKPIDTNMLLEVVNKELKR